MLPAPRAYAANPHLAAALAAAAERVPPRAVDEVWVFPARARGSRESGLAVLAAFVPGEPGQRTLYTVRYEAETTKREVRRTDAVQEEGTVPRDRLDRLVEGVVRRLGGGMETPEIRELAGDPARWSALLEELSGSVDERKR